MRRILLAVAAATATLAFAAVALAITNGGPDGNGHPEVGAMLAPHAFSDGTWETCTGTLISPTVFLTAAHCEGRRARCGHVRFVVRLEDRNDLLGHLARRPGVQKAQSDPHDLAVIVLDNAVKGITPGAAAEAGSSSTRSHTQPITSVGYGAQSVTMGAGGATFHYADSVTSQSARSTRSLRRGSARR